MTIGVIAVVAIVAGLAAWSMMAQDTPEQTGLGPSNLDSFNITQAKEGLAVPLIYGTVKITGNILWYGNLETEEIMQSGGGGGGKGGGGGGQEQVVGYNYYLDIWQGICQGPVNVLDYYIQNKKETPSAASINFNNGYTDTYYPTEVGDKARRLRGDERGVAHIFFKRWFIGKSTQSVPTIHYVMKSDLNALHSSIFSNAELSNGANPAAIVYDILIEAGVLPDRIDTSTFITAADYWASMEYGLNITFVRHMKVRDMVQSVLNFVDGMLVINSAGMFILKHFDPQASAVSTLSTEDFIEFTLTRSSWTEAYNDFKGTYKDEEFIDKALVVTNTAAEQLIGYKRTLTVDLKGFNNRDTASKRLWELMKRLSYPIAVIKFKTNLQYMSVDRGDVILIQHNDYNIVNAYFRVDSVSYENIDKNEISFTSNQIPERLFDVNYESTGESDWVNPLPTEVFPLLAQAVYELPYNQPTLSIASYLLLAQRNHAMDVGFFLMKSLTGTDYESVDQFSGWSQHGVLTEKYVEDTYNIDDTIGILYDPDREDPVFDSISRTDLFTGRRILLITTDQEAATNYGTSIITTLNKWIDLVKISISNVRVTNDLETITYIEDVDYEVKYNTGFIKPLKGYRIVEGQTLSVIFDYANVNDTEMLGFQTVTPEGTNNIRLTGCIRGLLHTPVLSHPIGSSIWLCEPSEANILQDTSISFYLKFLPYNPTFLLDAGDAIAMQVSTQYKAITPWSIAKFETSPHPLGIQLLWWPNDQVNKGAGVVAPEALNDQYPFLYSGNFNLIVDDNDPETVDGTEIIKNLTVGDHTAKIKQYVNDKYSPEKNYIFSVAVQPTITNGLFAGGWNGVNYYKIIDYVNITTLMDAATFGDLTASRWGLAATSDGTKGIFAGGWDGDIYYDIIEYVIINTTMNAQNFGDLFTARYTLTATSNGTRGIFAGGYDGSVWYKMIDYIIIANGGTAIDFGDLTLEKQALAATSNGNRGIFAGGRDQPNNLLNVIEYVEIVTKMNAQDFGDLTRSNSYLAATSNGTKGIFGGGYDGSASVTTIDYIDMAIKGNAIDFGNLTISRWNLAATSNGTRGIFAGGGDGSTYYNVIDYVEINEENNAEDFGDLIFVRWGSAATSGFVPSTQQLLPTAIDTGLFGGGWLNGGLFIIEYINISTGGNAYGFGDLTVARWVIAATSDGIKGIFVGGYASGYPNYYDIIEYVTIALKMDAINFGNLSALKNGISATSNGTRGIFAGGFIQDIGVIDIIDYITIADGGSAEDFGNLTQARDSLVATSNGTRGIFAGGSNSGVSIWYTIIDYVNITTLMDAATFGDLMIERRNLAATSNGTKGIFGGGRNGSTYYNVIDYVIIATTGDAADFGDLMIEKFGSAATSNGTKGIFGGGRDIDTVNLDIVEYVDIASLGNTIEFGNLISSRLHHGATSGYVSGS